MATAIPIETQCYVIIINNAGVIWYGVFPRYTSIQCSKIALEMCFFLNCRHPMNIRGLSCEYMYMCEVVRNTGDEHGMMIVFIIQSNHNIIIS